MKMRMFAFVLLAAVMVWGCSNDDPALQGVAFKMKATTTSSAINPGGRVMNSAYTFTKALVGVSEVEFENDDDDDSGDDDDLEIEFEGRYVVDLIAGTSSPEFGISNIDPGLYNEVEIELGNFLEGGNSMFVSFTYQPDAGEPIQVEFSTKAKLEIEIEYSNGFTMQPDVLSNVLVLLDLDTLLASVDLSQANVDEDGVIRINETSNTNLAQLIVSNFDDACDTGYDDDDDDEFDDD
ncbi:MAG: hypothetical protein KF846_08810 [Cyclobacteriaceae bacterium]|nr:hypothetical protein [Cyclobacteriaceae bacterium]MBX2956244.1 hypothetical protein [Cyclobacteriaceae bacterium]